METSDRQARGFMLRLARWVLERSDDLRRWGGSASLHLSREELGAASAFLAFYAALAAGALAADTVQWGALLPSILLAAALALLSAIDLKHFRLPDALTVPLALAGLAASHWTGAASLWWHVLSAVIGFCALAGLAAAYERVRKRPGLGLGDAKLLGAAGAWLGAEQLPDVLLWAAGAALVCLLAAILRGRRYSAGDAIPFGPFLAFGIWVAWLYGPVSPVWIR